MGIHFPAVRRFVDFDRHLGCDRSTEMPDNSYDHRFEEFHRLLVENQEKFEDDFERRCLRTSLSESIWLLDNTPDPTEIFVHEDAVDPTEDTVRVRFSELEAAE